MKTSRYELAVLRDGAWHFFLTTANKQKAINKAKKYELKGYEVHVDDNAIGKTIYKTSNEG